MGGHDLIVVGTSAGGVEALSALMTALPRDLPACICVVQHVSATRDSYLPRILNSARTLPVDFAKPGDAITAGRVFIAPRDRHLIIVDQHLDVVMGPKENNFRPAVDPLFRSAALSYRERVVGVVLSGALDCGTAGLVAIKHCGGRALVQDPDEALVGDMPRSAIENVTVDEVLPVAGLARRLIELAHTEPTLRGRVGTSLIESEVKIDVMSRDSELLPPIGTPAAMTCPSCAGPLYEVPGGRPLRFRCRVGHAFGSKSLSTEQANATEGAFWAALRALEEQASLARRLAARARELGQSRSSILFEERATTAEEQARIVREELLKTLQLPASASDGDPPISAKH